MRETPRSMYQYQDEDLSDLANLVISSNGKPELIAAELSDEPDRFDDIFQDFDVICIELQLDRPTESIRREDISAHIRRLEILRLDFEMHDIVRFDDLELTDEEWRPHFPGAKAVFVKSNGDEVLVYCHVTEFVEGTRKHWKDMRS